MQNIRSKLRAAANLFRWISRFLATFCLRVFTPPTERSFYPSKSSTFMNAPKIFPGQWHIFGHSQPPVIGTLRFEPDSGLTLEAQRHRQPDLLRMFDVAGSFQAPQVIQGVEGNGTPVTLFGCIATQTDSSRAFDQFHIRPLHALVGAHFDQFT